MLKLHSTRLEKEVIIMDLFNNIYFYLTIIIVIILIILLRLLSKKRVGDKKGDFSQVKQLINYLGGLDNIESVNASMSKISVKVVSSDLVNVESIKDIGASGVVETNKGFTFIFGSVSLDLADQINKELNK